MKQIIILGPPGSGKGTYSPIICKSYNLIHIPVGGILHNYTKISDNNLSKENRNIKKIIITRLKKGKLVPQSITTNIILNKLKKHINKSNGFLFDGYPRCIEQCDILMNTISKLGIFRINLVIILHVNKYIILNRLKKRKYIDNRLDDKSKKSIFNRINIYLENISKIIKYFYKSKIVHINTNNDIKIISDFMIKIIDKYL